MKEVHHDITYFFFLPESFIVTRKFITSLTWLRTKRHYDISPVLQVRLTAAERAASIVEGTPGFQLWANEPYYQVDGA